MDLKGEFVKIYTAWLLCFVMGLALLVLTGVIFPLFPQEMAIPNGLDSPVIAFEFARTHADLVAVFGHIDDPLRAERILAMNQGNQVDMAYMVVYSSFIALFFYAAYLKNRQVIWLVFVATALLAGVADAVENSILFDITDNLELASGLNLLPYPVHIKFLALFVCAFGVGMFLKDSRKSSVRIFGYTLQGLSPLAVILTLVGLVSAATIVITLAWLTQLIIAYGEYRREKRAAA